MDIPKAGNYARHIRTGDLYRVVKLTQMKMEDSYWKLGVNYVPADARQGDFTRDAEFFCTNFEPVESSAVSVNTSQPNENEISPPLKGEIEN